MARLRFGGEALKKGEVTWYDHINPDGQSAGQVFVRPGDEVDEERVTDAQGLIDRKQAERVADAAPAAVGA